jgi:tetratricopeptide (TPR) repeat protein
MPSRGETGVIKPLAKDAIPLIEWRLRDLSLPESKVILTGMPACANCHSFSDDGETLGMDVDGPDGDKGAYAIAKLERTTVIDEDDVITWNDFEGKPEGHKTIGFLSRISPDGRFALTTLNESLYVANFTDFRFLQVFYPTRGILAWTSPETGRIEALPGADDPEYVHCDPAWFPGGEQIVFARAGARDPYEEGRPLATYPGDPHEIEIRYDLYRMPFAEGRGGTPVRIVGASENGMSNTFPKVSPDGRWIVFTKCANGQLMRPDGRLWIVPAEGGEAREMRCNTSRMNSWHSFSPNGRWMVFSSKVNTPYTQMFITHIDEDGNDTPPVLVPNSTAANRAVNIPEFVNRSYAAFDAIDVPAVAHHRRFQEGTTHAHEGRHEEAVAAFEAALEEEPEFSRALITLGFSLLALDRVEEARERLELAVRVAPLSSEAHNNLGLALERQGEAAPALDHLRRAVQLDGLNARAWHNLGLALFRRGDVGGAADALAEASRLDPGHAGFHNDFGFLLERVGRPTDAIREYRAAVAIDPGHLRARMNLGFALLTLGNLTGALEQYEQALILAPGDAGIHRSLSTVRLKRGELGEAVAHLERVLELAPDDSDTRLTLAWHLATLPDESLRDGARAVALAEAAGGETPRALDIRAAAYAEAGRYEEAVAAAQQALVQVRAGAGRVTPGLEARIAAYEAGRPYRQPKRRAP